MFGLATVASGVRVLLGGDPGYVVFRPLLIFNTVMGLVYIVAGLIGWGDTQRGRRSSLGIWIVNGLVLLLVGYLHMGQGTVAIESVHAMVLRTSVWVVLFLGWHWVDRGSHQPQRI